MSVHDKKQKIINYEQKSYFCDKHNDNYIKYCNQCKINICILCEKNHKNHDIIYLGDICILCLLPDEDYLLNKMIEFRNMIDKLIK